MTALSGPKKLATRLGDQAVVNLVEAGLKGSTTFYTGALCVLENGYAVPGKTGLGLIPLGQIEEKIVTAAGDGARRARFRRGPLHLENSAGGDAIAATDEGKPCYIVDDQTVALTDGNGTRSRAGTIMGLDADTSQVIVEVYRMEADPLGGAGTKNTYFFTFDLADLAAVDVVAKFQPGYPGKIVKFQATVLKPATTAAKAATLTPQINAALGADVPVTGGGLTLTSANMTPIGATVQSAAITGANSFTAADGISILGSAITAFVEGRVVLALTVASA